MTYFDRENDDTPMSTDELLDLAERRPGWMSRAECRTERAQTLAWTFGHEHASDLFVAQGGQGGGQGEREEGGRVVAAGGARGEHIF